MIEDKNGLKIVPPSGEDRSSQTIEELSLRSRGESKPKSRVLRGSRTTRQPTPIDQNRPIRVLAVEDERIVARYLSARLSKLGYEVAGLAASRREALELVDSTRPDLVLMDIQLNGVSEGIEAARAIRDQFAIPVVYLTAHSDSKTLERVKATEPFGYLIKPFDDRNLAVAIETAMTRYRSEKRLQDSEERLRLAQKAGRIGVFDWNIEIGEILFTPELEEIYGFASESFEGTEKAWIDRFPSDDQSSFQEFLDEWLASDRVDEHWQHRIVRPDGEVRWIEARGRLYRDVNSRAWRMLGTELDITKRKRMEESLRRTQLELQRSNSDLQAYAYSVSHDLKEPLRAISCSVGLLEKHCAVNLDEMSREYMALAIDGARRMKELIDGLLQFSRVGQDEQPMTVVDCNAVVEEVLASVAVRVEESGAHVAVDPLPTVHAWRGRLSQLFQNLIGNALKYRKPDVAPEIRISAACFESEWRFVIDDNGIGFDMKYAEQIFGVFKRLNTKDLEGTGIGLSVCKRIIERHGGRIWAESEPGIGTKFYFTIPADHEAWHS